MARPYRSFGRRSFRNHTGARERGRQIQIARFERVGIFSNAQMTSALIKKHCKLAADSMKFLEKAVEKLGLSARAYHRILKIARTIADLEASPDIQAPHVAEAIQYRTLDRQYR